MSTPANKDGWSAEAYNRNASFVYSNAYTAAVLSLLDAKPGDRIMDFGCGSGELTIQIEKVATQQEGGVVVGVDGSGNMINKARSNGLQKSFVSDIQDLTFPTEWEDSLRSGFDAVFSNATLHWCKRNPAGVLKSAKSVLKPGGRLAAELGGFMNVVGVRSALHQVLHRRGYDPVELDPWYFPTADEYKKLLENAGFEVKEIGLHPRLTPLPGPLYDWLVTFARTSCLKDMPDEEAESIMKEIENICEVDCRGDDGKWAIMYCRLRFLAIVPQ